MNSDFEEQIPPDTESGVIPVQAKLQPVPEGVEMEFADRRPTMELLLNCGRGEAARRELGRVLSLLTLNFVRFWMFDSSRFRCCCRCRRVPIARERCLFVRSTGEL